MGQRRPTHRGMLPNACEPLVCLWAAPSSSPPSDHQFYHPPPAPAGECVGIAFQSLKHEDAENISYIIPTPGVDSWEGGPGHA